MNAAVNGGGGLVIDVVDSGGGRLVVSAKAVHAALGVGRNFSNWIKGRISRYKFEAGVDFWNLDSPVLVNQDAQHGGGFTPKRAQTSGFTPKRGKTSSVQKDIGGRPELDYWLSLDMAKELAMLERSDAGRAARKYFLACEKKLQETQAGLAAIGLRQQEAQKLLEPEYKLSPSDRDMFLKINHMRRNRYDLAHATENDLDLLVLPYVLRDAMEDAGVADEVVEKMDLEKYAASHVLSKISVGCGLNESDVAYRLERGAVSPRFVKRSQIELAMIHCGIMFSKTREEYAANLRASNSGR